jgi:UDP-N-acetylglucosamine 2-epimerase (non-hydrolysing)
MTPTVVGVVGARPNFIKMLPVIEALGDEGIDQVVVHTGQHYDRRMSENILVDLRFPTPDIHLGIGSGTHGEQTGRTIIAFEEVLLDERPELVIVAGDVNATIACALAAVKLGIPVAHIESGLRSGDWSMPEEINRVLTDRVSTLLFTHSPEAHENLASEGIPADRVHHVGNTMIDSLMRALPEARRRAAWERFGVQRHEYVLVTLHRPSNVDDRQQLSAIVDCLVGLAATGVAIVFPVHPRTLGALQELGHTDRLTQANVRCCEPLGYLDFLSLEAGAGAILTDSGGIQEESTALGVRCYTLRKNTERPVTLSLGTNVLIGDDPQAILGIRPTGEAPVPCHVPLWDGRAGERIGRIINDALQDSGLPITSRDIEWAAR